MASVQELMLALEGQKSPFVNFLEGVAGGFKDSQDHALDRARTMLLMEEKRRDMEQKAKNLQEQEQIKQIMAQRAEQQTQGELSKVSSPSSVMPIQKFKEVLKQGPDGYSRSFEQVDATGGGGASFIFPHYVDEQGKTRIGRASKTTGIIQRSPDDPIAPATPGNSPTYHVLGSQDGQVSVLNPKTLETKTVPLPGKGPLMSTAQTAEQANAKLYATRMAESAKQLDDLDQRIDLSSAGTAIQGAAPNFLKSADVQTFEQAKRNFLLAVLRRESGAAISTGEFQEGNKQYFTVMGDSPEVKAQKAMNRKAAVEGLQNAAGMAPSSTPPANSTPTPTRSKTPAGKIKVSNGKETLLIDPADAADAAKDGYSAVQ